MTTFGESLYGGTLRCYKIIATEADLPSAGGNIDASSINIDNKWEIRLDASSNFILENTAISINSIIGDAHSGKITLYDYNLEDLENVTITDLSNGQILKYNSTASTWENVTDPSGVETLNDLTDVTITNLTNGQILQYNEFNELWENATLPTGVETLNDLTDVTITNLANGQILMYNDFDEQWQNSLLPTGITLLSELTDVAITNVANGQILRYDDSNEVWENITPTYLDGANLPDNFLIKSVNNQAVSSHLFSTATTTTNQLEFTIPTDPLFNVLSGVIQTTTNALGTVRRMNLATSYIANTRGLTITETGRVGIGILNPEEDLEIDGSIQIDSAVTARLKFQQSGQNPHALGEIDAEQDGTNGGDLQFYTKIDGGSVTEKLRINNIGAVGIGGANFGNTGQVIVSNGPNNSVGWSSTPVFTALTAETIDAGVTQLNINLNTTPNKHVKIQAGYPDLFFIFHINTLNVEYNGAPDGLYLNYNGGAVYYGYPPSALSDDRIKFNETNITNGLEVIRKLSPERYTKKLPTQNVGTEEAGFIAQEVLQIPELQFAVTHPNKEIIEGDPNTRYYTLTYDSIFTYAVAGLKELDTIVQKQAQLISSLEARINTLEGN